MARPSKYPEKFRRDALELVKEFGAADRGGGPIVGDQRGYVVELGQSGP